MSRRAWASVDLSALQHNLGRVRAYAPNAKVMAAIKADGYGHGLIEIAQALTEADAFAVACIDEAIRLRQAGIKHPIVLLSGPFGPAELSAAQEHDLQVVLHCPEQLAVLENAGSAAGLQVWIKLDSGMHRIGFPAAQSKEVYNEINKIKDIKMVGWLTHLACADEVENQATALQLRTFADAIGDLPGARSAANSAGIVAWPDSHQDWVRPGIMLYGASPLLDQTAEELDLQPVMTLQAELIAVRQLKKYDAVGYGATWRCPEDMPVGVVAIGYGDGYPRHCGNGAPVLINGRCSRTVGRISMDMTSIDLRDCPEAKVGDVATLWGEGLPADEVARHAGTIAYELFCGLSRRVSSEYRD